MLASKFLDPVVGVDIHLELTPFGTPAPFPNPFVGLIFDPGGLLEGTALSYAQALATGTVPTGPVFINSLPAANVGTEATNSLGVPHILIPPGVSWAPMPKPPKPVFKGPPEPPGPPIAPEGDAVHVFGSQTVSIMGSSAVRMGDYALSCGEPVRLPSSVAMAVPMGAPVMIGGPTGLSLLDAAGHLVRTKWVAGHLHALVSRMSSVRLRNLLSKAVCFLTGHPVDVATGRVLTDAVDFELPGALPLRLERHYSSAWAGRAGPLGHGWSHSLDQAIWVERGKVVYLEPEGREIEFDTFDFPDRQLPLGAEVYEPISRLTLTAHGQGRYTIVTHDGVQRDFAPLERSRWRDGRVGGAYGAGGGANGDSNDVDLAARRRSWSRLVRESTLAGARIEYEYDAAGRLAAVSDGHGRRVTFEHDALGRLTAAHLPHPTRPGHTLPHVRYTYGARGDLTEATDALGRVSHYTYEGHLLTQETNRNGLSFYFAYDGFGHNAYCVRTWGDGGIYDHLITYDKAGRKTSVKNSLGYNTTYFMNPAGLVTKVIGPLGGTTHYEYHEPSLQRSKLIDPMGGETTWAYDERGNCTELIGADGARQHIEYDSRNLPTQLTDAIGGTWRWTYDRQRRLEAGVDPLGRRTQFHWDGPLLTGVTDAAGQYTHLQYDDAGNLTALIAPDRTTTRWAHDLRGRCVKVTDPNGNEQRREHDLVGRVTRVSEPDGNDRHLEYDPEGNVIHTRDRDHDVRFEYQGMSRLAARSEAGTRVAFQYDTEEQLVAIVNEHGAVYRFVVDAAGNVAEEHGFDGLRRRYQRDKAGRVTRVDRPEGASSTYTYDAAGRVTGVAHSDGSRETYAYRADGELILAQNAATALELERDPLGRLLREKRDGHWVASEYDALGRRRTLRSSKGLEQRIRRNAMGDVVTVEASVRGEPPSAPQALTSGVGASTIGVPPNDPFRVDFERDRLGLELERRLPGGVQARWQRDNLGRPRLHELSVHGVTRHVRQYTWGTNDRLRAILDSLQGPIEYTHDAFGNLAAATYQDGRVELRMPDAVGNLFKTKDRTDRKYGPAGQLLEAHGPRGITRYEYDAEGNLITKTEPDGKRWRYRWRLDGTLSSVERPDGELVTFTYDALGRRISKTYRGKTTLWIWDGNVPLHEWVELTEAALLRDGPTLRTSLEREIALAKRASALSRRKAQGPPPRATGSVPPTPPSLTSTDAAIDHDPEIPLLEGTPDAPITWLFEPESFAPLAKLVSDERYSIITDHLGTPTTMLDALGQESWSAFTDTYGALHDLRGARRACPFRFPGQYEDAETGLCYNWFRYYDPEAGQYVTQDPIGLLGGPRAYGYVGNTLILVDPLGLSGCDAQRELAAIGPLNGKRRADIESNLRARGFSSAPAHSGGSVWTKPMLDGTTAAVRVDPATVRTPAKNWADEVPHAHKETVSTADVIEGNYPPKKAITLDDAGQPSTSPSAKHIPIIW